MANVMENRNEVVRYGKENKYLKEFGKFGWTLQSKQLLNRFGNPLPLDEARRISEDDLREKCSYNLKMVRVVDDSIVNQLHSLEHEYQALEYYPASFGGGRVSGSVWLSLVSISLILVGIWGMDINSILCVALITFGVICGMPIAFIFMSGCSKVSKERKKNLEIKNQKDNLVDQAQKLLNK